MIQDITLYTLPIHDDNFIKTNIILKSEEDGSSGVLLISDSEGSILVQINCFQYAKDQAVIIDVIDQQDHTKRTAITWDEGAPSRLALANKLCSIDLRNP